MSDPFHLLDPTHHDNPYPSYARLRTEAPVYFSDEWNGWIITRYADVAAGLRDERMSSNRAAGYVQKLPPPGRDKLAPLIRNISAWTPFTDPPEHARRRGLLNKAFTPRLVEMLRPRIQQMVADLLDPLGGSSRVDIVASVANLLPVRVIGEMLGLPREEWNHLKQWSDALAAFFGTSPPVMDIATRALQAIVELEDYFRGKVHDRRIHPGEDLLSSLVTAEEQGSVLSENELFATCATVLFGGHESTAKLIGNAVYTMLSHPDQKALLFSDPAAVSGAVEEVLRFESPFIRVGRAAKQDFEIGGRHVKQHDRIFLVLAAANRDPQQFSDPDRFDILRRDNRHLSFGTGAHFCLGAALARAEAQIAIETIFRRFPAMRLVDDRPRWMHNFTLRGLEALEVDLGPAAASAAPVA